MASRYWSLVLLHVPLIALVVAPGAVRAQIPSLEWSPPKVVDTGVTPRSDVANFSIEHYGEAWRVAYEKDGDIYVARSGPLGWGSRTRLTNDAEPQTRPRIARGGSDQRLYVVWEDHGGAHPEVCLAWSYGLEWSPTLQVSADAIPSRSPDIAQPYVVWEDSTDTGFQVLGRKVIGSTLYDVELLSSPSASAREPAVSINPYGYGLTVVWTDFRHADPQIYSRRYNDQLFNWGAESRVTNLNRPYGKPSVTVETGETQSSAPVQMVFEGTVPSGAIEIFYKGYGSIEQVSADDGISSARPNIAGFRLPYDYCGFNPSGRAQTYTTWTEIDPSGSNSHTVWSGALDDDPVEGISYSAIGAIEGNPTAGIAQAWISEIEGTPVLMARIGRVPGCSYDALEGSGPLLVAPGGTPANRVHAFDACSGAPIEGMPIGLQVSQTGIRWDPEQNFYLSEWTNGDGDAFFPLRGGGCTEEGVTRATCAGTSPTYDWTGIKSPDQNANCIVDLDDLAYVEDLLGTDDYCADLDGSGTVTEEDLAIVEMTLWDHCSDVVGIEDLVTPIEPALYVHPNPARTTVRIRTALPAETGGVLQIIDPCGRLVRAMALPLDGGGARTMAWDLRSDAGRRVTPGIYFAVLRADHVGTRIARPILVMR